MDILTSFRLTTSGRGKISNLSADCWSMEKIAEHINKTVLQTQPSCPEEYLNSAYEQYKDIVLHDDKNGFLNLQIHNFAPFLQDQLMFLFARITDVKRFRKDVVHLFCEYATSSGIYHGCFIMSSEQYSMMHIEPDEGDVRFLVGTCVRKTYRIPPKKTYNSHSHSSYVSGLMEEKQRNRMITCTMFNVPFA